MYSKSFTSFGRRAVAWTSLVALVFTFVGTNLSIPKADAVSNVTLTDNDVNPGFTGQDFSGSWTLQDPLPSGYMNYQIFLFRASKGGFTKDNILIDACNGPCSNKGNLNNVMTTSWNGPSQITVDSDNQPLDPQNQYKLCVLTVTEGNAGNSLACSNNVTLTGEAIPENPNVSSVVLADKDVNVGLDGRDFSIGWIGPNPAQQAFQQFLLYIFKADKAGLNKDNVAVDACNGQACISAGNRIQSGDNSFIGPSNLTTDAEGVALNAQNQYKACVLVVTEGGAGNSFACSGATTIVADQAPSGVSNVTLADNDSNAGLDGRDFSAGWTNPNPMTEGFQNLKVYFFQEAMAGLSKDSIATNACNGQPCTPAVTLNQPGNTFLGPNNLTTDGKGNAFGAFNYKACVLLTATGGNSFACSGAVAITSDQGPQAPGSGGVTGLTLADIDTTGFGLNGLDFTTTWTPSQTPVVGFNRYLLYILPNDLPVDGNTVGTNACSGNPCGVAGQLTVSLNNFYTLPQYMPKDGVFQSWNPATQYKACILTDTQNPANRKFDCSSAATVTSDNVDDHTAPRVEHVAPTKGVGAANNYFYVQVTDDQTLSSHFATLDDGRSEYIKIHYGLDVSVAETEANATLVMGELFQFMVPGNFVPAIGGTYEYYIEAKDNTGNLTVVCANPLAVDVNSCKNNPFVVQTKGGGQRSVLGRTLLGDQGLANTRVFITSWAVQAVNSDESGNYSINGLKGDEAYELSAYNMGKCANQLYVVVANGENRTNANITLMNGCQNGGEKPRVVSSMPSQGMTGVDPTMNKIMVMVSSPLDASTVNKTDSTVEGSNIYLTTTGADKIAGATLYCESSLSQGCGSLIGPSDSNAIVFIPTNPLSTQKSYSLVINENVIGTTGQPIDGNRSPYGYQLNFFTSSGAMNFQTMQQNFASGGNYMPPYVTVTNPTSGMSISSNSKLTVGFNAVMDTSTLTSSNIKLKDPSNNNVPITVAADGGQKMITITPTSALSSGEYRLDISSAVKNTLGVCMMSSCSADTNAFSINFNVRNTSDSAVPTVTPGVEANSTIFVNLGQGALKFGFSETMDATTVNATTVTMLQGSSNISVSVTYLPNDHSVEVMPLQALTPNSQYSILFSAGNKDSAGNALAPISFTYKTGSADQTAPTIQTAECDDYTCKIQFTEPVSNDGGGSSSFNVSALNSENVTITENNGPDLVAPDGQGVTPVMSYIAVDKTLVIEGLSLTKGAKADIVIENVTDLAGNGIADNANATEVTVKDSQLTFGNFGMDMGGMMYAPPTIGMGGMMNMTNGGGFGATGITADQYAFGEATVAYAGNNVAGKDAGVFQVRVTPGVALQNGDILNFTFPSGTTLTNAQPDGFSLFYKDLNGSSGAGTVAFDPTFDNDGVSVNDSTHVLSVKLAITGGTPGINDRYVFEFRTIVNPSLAKGFDTSGYTVRVQGSRSAVALFDKTSMPYYIQTAGQNSITVNIFAGSQETPVTGATGDIYLMAGGPTGSLDNNVTLTNGIVTKVNGVDASNVSLSGLLDGCYFLGTDSLVTLGGADYYGKDRPESICVDANNRNKTYNIVLSAANDNVNAVPLTVKIAGIDDFNGKDVEIFAGGPGTFITKQITDLTTPDADGYILRLNSNGQWFVGIQPALAKGQGTGIPDQLPGVPPSPMQLNVSGLGTEAITISNIMSMNPPGTSFDANTNTLTFTFATADKNVTGQVTDGTTGLANVQVFIFNQGFGMPSFGSTDAAGNFSINLTSYGSYEIGAFMNGLPSSNFTIEVRPDGSDQGSDPDVYFKGKQVTDQNPLVIKLNKPSFSISGKVMDANGNGIGYAPVFAKNEDGTFVSGGTDANGSYTLFVAAGTWTVRSELPPDKTDACGTFTKEVVISDASKTNQNIEPTGGTCVTLSGTVTASGTALANVSLSVEAWDVENDRPEMGGGSRFSSTDSSGNFNVKVAGNTTYRIGTWSTDSGEISTTQVVGETDVSNISVTNGTTGTITFSFTGGTSSMEAFVELKKTNDVFTRISKSQKGLNNSFAFTMKEGSYTYFINVIGVGEYSGPVSTGGTVTIDLSAKQLMTLSGNVKDTEENVLPGVLVSLKDSTGFMQNAVTNASGNYSINVKAGNYAVSVSMAGYVAGESPKTVALNQSIVNYDFGGASPDQAAMIKALYTIEGTIYQSNGSTPANNGFVTAVETTNGFTVTGPIDAQDGGYSIPVNNGTWTLKAVSPLHAKTTLGTNVVVNGGNQTGKDITLTADATKESTSTSKSLAANTGGSFNDTGNTDVKMTVGAGVLETGSGNVTLNMEKSFTAPDTASFAPLGDAAFTIEATGSSAIKNLNGNAEITIDFSDLVDELPEGYNESDLKLAYFSNERNEYILVEGGYTIDPVNNTVTGLTSHFTDFALVVPTESAPTTPTDLVATAISSTRVDLTWTAVDGATGYDIYRDTDPSGLFPRVGSEPTVGDVTSYSDTDLTASTLYYYKVSAVNDIGESAASSSVPVTTEAESPDEPDVPTTPTGLAATAASTTRINLSWTAVAGVTGYNIYRSTTSNGIFSRVGSEPTVASGVTTYSDTNLNVATRYYYKISAVNGDEESVLSSAVSATTNAAVTPSTTTTAGGTEDDSQQEEEVTTGEEEVTSGEEEVTTGEEEVTSGEEEVTSGEEEVTTSDYADHWATSYIEIVKDRGIAQGIDATHFAPDQTITRAELVKMVVNAAQYTVQPVTETDFSDVDPTAWYAPYVVVAQENGMVQGYEDNTFKPAQAVTRAEALKILFEGVIKKNIILDPSQGMLANFGLDVNPFSDLEVDQWYSEYVLYAYVKGIVSGYADGTFGPENSMTRAEFTKVLVLSMGW